MSDRAEPAVDLVRLARDWVHAMQADVCDVAAPRCLEAARDASRLWIGADDEDRPKKLYKRLGFEPVLTTLEFLRLV